MPPYTLHVGVENGPQSSQKTNFVGTNLCTNGGDNLKFRREGRVYIWSGRGVHLVGAGCKFGRGDLGQEGPSEQGILGQEEPNEPGALGLVNH